MDGHSEEIQKEKSFHVINMKRQDFVNAKNLLQNITKRTMSDNNVKVRSRQKCHVNSYYYTVTYRKIRFRKSERAHWQATRFPRNTMKTKLKTVLTS